MEKNFVERAIKKPTINIVILKAIWTTPKSEFEAQELLKLAKDYYRKKGVGRPTKKDRRDINDLYYKHEEE